MNSLLKTVAISLSVLFAFNQRIFAQEANIKTTSTKTEAPDSLNFRIFQDEKNFQYFLAEEISLPGKYPVLSLKQNEKDSLFLVLNRDKKIIISKKYLIEFNDFSVEEPVSKKIMVQTMDLFPKDKIVKYSFEVEEGDHFFLKFSASKGGAFGTEIEVLLNEIRVDHDMSLNREKEFDLDFVSSQKGKVDVVFRNFGIFKLHGEIEIDIKPRKEKIRLQEDKFLQVYKKNVISSINDTLFKTVVDEAFTVSHKLNLKGNSIFLKQIELSPDFQVLGFAIFLYPYEEKESLEIQRREVFREDPLQDFALKELTGKSYTYLPEYSLPDLHFSISEFNDKNHWLNGQNQVSDSWKLSSNSKNNYAFFELKEEFKDNKINVKVINRSALYNYEIGLKMILLFVENFTVSEEVEIQEFEDIIILTLI
jgi:hypothetical protein